MCTGLHIVCLHVKFMPLILALLVGSWKNTYYLCDQVCGGVTELSWLGLSTFLFLVCSVICYAFCHLFVLLVGFCGGTCLLSHNWKLCKDIITITHLYKPYLLRNESNDSESYFCSIALTCSEVFIYKTKWIHKLQTWKSMAFHHSYMFWHVKFISCLYMFWAHVLVIRRSKLRYTASGILSQPVHETATYDTRGCATQFWPPDDGHMCSKHVEAWNKLIVKQKFCASCWLITEINTCAMFIIYSIQQRNFECKVVDVHKYIMIIQYYKSVPCVSALWCKTFKL